MLLQKNRRYLFLYVIVAVIHSSALCTSCFLQQSLLVAVSPVSVLAGNRAVPHLTVIPFTLEILCSLIQIQFNCA